MSGICISVILKDGVERIRQGKFPQLAEMQMTCWVLPTLEKKKKRLKVRIYMDTWKGVKGLASDSGAWKEKWLEDQW